MNIADRSLRVGQILLSDQHERPLGHPSGVDVSLGGGQFAIVTDHVHRARPTRVRVRPGHAAVDGEVDLERTRATPELGEGARDSPRKTVTEDAGDRAWRQIEHRDICRRQLRRLLDPDPRLDLAAQVAQQRDHRVGDRLRSARCHRPAVPMPGRDDAHPDRRGHRVVQRPEGMGRNASEQGAALLGAEHVANVDAGSTVGAPNRASISGWCGIRSSGPMMSSLSASNRDAE